MVPKENHSEKWLKKKRAIGTLGPFRFDLSSRRGTFKGGVERYQVTCSTKVRSTPPTHPDSFQTGLSDQQAAFPGSGTLYSTSAKSFRRRRSETGHSEPASQRWGTTSASPSVSFHTHHHQQHHHHPNFLAHRFHRPLFQSTAHQITSFAISGFSSHTSLPVYLVILYLAHAVCLVLTTQSFRRWSKTFVAMAA